MFCTFLAYEVGWKDSKSAQLVAPMWYRLEEIQLQLREPMQREAKHKDVKRKQGSTNMV